MTNFLDPWILERISGSRPLKHKLELTRRMIEDYQLKKINESLEYARANSTFYAEKLMDIGEISSLKDFERVPTTTEEELREFGMKMICVPQGQVSRIVTLETGGTKGFPKRVYFTEEDQELTVDYFHHGMQNMVSKEDKVLILFPYKRPGSIGDLLHRGLSRLGAKSIPYGLAEDYTDLEAFFRSEQFTSLVGMPSQIGKLSDIVSDVRLNSVLLSAEYVPQHTVDLIKKNWKCKVYEHYGMTEMGLGGAVSCDAFEGYHPRENDLYFEIDEKIGSENDGWGEVIFTTLNRKGMPLIRYRTGDCSRWIEGSCSCGSVLKKLDRVGDRKIPKFDYKNNKMDIPQV